MSQSSQAPKKASRSRIFTEEEIKTLLDFLLEQSAKAPGGNFPLATYDAAAAHISTCHPGHPAHTGAQVKRQYSKLKRTYSVLKSYNTASGSGGPINADPGSLVCSGTDMDRLQEKIKQATSRSTKEILEEWASRPFPYFHIIDQIAGPGVASGAFAHHPSEQVPAHEAFDVDSDRDGDNPVHILPHTPAALPTSSAPAMSPAPITSPAPIISPASVALPASLAPADMVIRGSPTITSTISEPLHSAPASMALQASRAQASSSYGKRKRATYDDISRSSGSRYSKHTVSSTSWRGSTASTSAGAALAVSISGMSNAMSAMSTSLHEASINSSHITLKSLTKLIEQADGMQLDDKNLLHFYYSTHTYAASLALAMSEERRLGYWKWLLQKMKSGQESASGADSLESTGQQDFEVYMHSAP